MLTRVVLDVIYETSMRENYAGIFVLRRSYDNKIEDIITAQTRCVDSFYPILVKENVFPSREPLGIARTPVEARERIYNYLLKIAEDSISSEEELNIFLEDNIPKLD
jgi:hypothetical protein